MVRIGEKLKKEIHKRNIVFLNERISTTQGVFALIAIQIGASYFSLFAINVLHASNYQVSLITSLPQLMGLLTMIPAARIVNRIATKKGLLCCSVLIARSMLLLMAFVPFLPPEISATVFVILVGLMNVPGTFALLSWQSFIGGVIPEKRRNPFFAKRNRVVATVTMIFVLTVGVAMYFQPSSNPVPFQILFITGFICGVIEVYVLNKHIEITEIEVKEKKESAIFTKQIFSHKPYVIFLCCALFYNFAFLMAGPLLSIYQVDYASAGFFWISIFTVSYQIAQIIAFPIWGRLADRYQNSTLLCIAGIGTGLAATLQIISTDFVWITIMNGMHGFFIAGTSLLLFNTLLGVSKEEIQTSFITNYNFLLAFVAFLAPQFGVLLLEVFNMSVAIHTSFILRIIAGMMFLGMSFYMKKNNSVLKYSK